MGYGIEVSGSDSNGSFLITDADDTLIPFIIANIGEATSVEIPDGDCLVFAHAQSGSTTARNALNATLDTDTNIVRFYQGAAAYNSNTSKGTTTVSTTWTAKSTKFVVLSPTKNLNVFDSQSYGVRIQKADGTEVFDTRKISTNDVFRILATYTPPFDSTNTYLGEDQTMNTDEDMYVEMTPFIRRFSSTSTGTTATTPDTRWCVGPRFRSTEVKWSNVVSSLGFGRYRGDVLLGKVIYNSTDSNGNSTTDYSAALPSGWSAPY